MFDDIRDLIDQAALKPDPAHRDALWARFAADANDAPKAVEPQAPRQTVLRVAPAAGPEVVAELTPDLGADRPTTSRWLYGMLAAAAIVAAVGLGISMRKDNRLQAQPAATTAVPTTVATVTTTPPAIVAISTTVAKTPVTTVTPTTVPAPTTVPTTSPVVITTTVNVPKTQKVTVLGGTWGGGLYAIGEWSGSSFTKTPASISSTAYSLVGGGTATLDPTTVKLDTHGHATVDQTNLDATKSPTRIAVSAASWTFQPRPVKDEGDQTALKDARFDIYRDEARSLAIPLGGKDVVPTLTSVVRADLDGDGSEEVVVSAQVVGCDGPICDPGTNHAKGSYGLVYVRRVFGSGARSTVLASVVVADGQSRVPDLRVLGAGDLNGDGVMEVFGSRNPFEDPTYYVWDAGSAEREPKVIFSPSDFD